MSCFTWGQTDGVLYSPQGDPCGSGYSGKGEGKNNALMQNVRDVGPIPCGLYTIEPPADDPKVGAYAMRLTPDPSNQMFGRTDFLCHGDNMLGNESASEGCVILNKIVRYRMWQSGVRCLRVVAQFQPTSPNHDSTWGDNLIAIG